MTEGSSIKTPYKKIMDLATSFDGERLAVLADVDAFSVYTVSDGQEVFNKIEDKASHLAFTPEGTFLAVWSSGEAGKITFYTRSGTAWASLRTGNPYIGGVVFTSDEKFVIVYGQDAHVRVWPFPKIN